MIPQLEQAAYALSHFCIEQLGYRIEGIGHNLVLGCALPFPAIRGATTALVAVVTLEYFNSYTPHLSLAAAKKDFEVVALFLDRFQAGMIQAVMDPIRFHKGITYDVRDWPWSVSRWAFHRPYLKENLDPRHFC